MLPNDTPLVAIDVSKGKSHAQGFLCRGYPRGKPFSFDHTKTGFSRLEAAVSALRGEAGKEPAVAFEHTGVYSRVVAKWAESAGIRQIAISPLLSAKARKSKLRPTKNDSLDCKSIAEAAYGSDVGEARAPSALLALSRQREAASSAAAEAKARYRMRIDLCWPCLDAFADPLSNAAMAAVMHYRHPAAVLRAGPKRVEAFLRKSAPGLGRSSAKALAAKLCDYARESMPPVGESSAEVDSLLRAADEAKSAMGLEGELASRLIEEARKSGGFGILTSIDGVGERLAASILAEIGDVSRFPNQGKIAAYAGLDPAVCQSGRSGGLHLRITRKGNAFLRKYLYIAVLGCCSGRRSNRIKEFVDRKQKGGLPRKAALVAGCRKMLLVIRAMLLNGTAFEH